MTGTAVGKRETLAQLHVFEDCRTDCTPELRIQVGLEELWMEFPFSAG